MSWATTGADVGSMLTGLSAVTATALWGRARVREWREERAARVSRNWGGYIIAVHPSVEHASRSRREQQPHGRGLSLTSSTETALRTPTWPTNSSCTYVAAERLRILRARRNGTSCRTSGKFGSALPRATPFNRDRMRREVHSYIGLISQLGGDYDWFTCRCSARNVLARTPVWFRRPGMPRL